MPEDLNTEPVEPETPNAEGDTQDQSPEPETFDREYVEKLRKEAANYRTKLREREEAEAKAAEAKRQAELSSDERAKEAERKAEQALADAEARVTAAERRASLAGKVTSPARVMRLMDDPDTYFPNGDPDIDAILRDFPEYTPNAATASVTAGNATNTREAIRGPQDLKGKTPAEINAYLEKHHNFEP